MNTEPVDIMLLSDLVTKITLVFFVASWFRVTVKDCGTYHECAL